MTRPAKSCTTPATSAPPKTAGSPYSTATGKATAAKTKPLPLTMGRRAPTGPSPTPWTTVVRPATRMATWMSDVVSAASAPMRPARMIGMVTLLANIASTCWKPSRTCIRSGG